MANDIIDINVTETVETVQITVNPNLTTVNINKVTGGLNQTLQSVTDLGSTTSNSITANSFIKSGGTGANVLLDNGNTTSLTSIVGTTNLTYTSGIFNGVVNSNTGTDATIPLADSTNAGLFSAAEKTKLSGIAPGAEVNVNADWNAVSGDAVILNKPTGLATTTYVDNKDNSQQLQLNYLDRDNSIFDTFYLRTIADGGTVEASNQLLSSLAVLRSISYVNQGYTQQINADKFVKLGGTSSEYLMADGSVSEGGGGSGGATNLAYIASPTNGIVTSNTGTDATIPLANGTNAGVSSNDYTTSEKNLVATIPNINIDAIDRITVKYGESISKGQAIYISSATGTNIIVSKASNINDALSSKTLAIAESTGVLNDIKTVVLNGLLTGLDTSTATIGDSIWLGTNGNLIYGDTNKPVAPAHLVYIGVVSKVHATNGEIFVNIQNGFEVKELHDVAISGLANEDFLQYETSTSLWKNIQLTASWIRAKLGITTLSGSNTGDNATNTQYSGLATSKQDTLVSGTNIKTINGSSVLGSGDLTISGTGISSLNGLTGATQTFATGTSGTDLNIVSTGTTHTVNIPNAGTSSRGLITNASQSIVGDKSFTGGTTMNPTTANNALTVNNTGSGNGNGIEVYVPNAGIEVTTTGNTGAYAIKGTASSGNNGIYATTLSGTAIRGIASSTGIGGEFRTGTGTYIATFYGNNVLNASILNDGTIVAKNLKQTNEQVLPGTPAWTGTTAPSGATNHSYMWSQAGNVVTLRVNLDSATAGSALTAVTFDLPPDCPTPEVPAGVSAAGDVINYGVGNLTGTRAVPTTPTATSCALRLKSTSPNTFEVNIWRASGSHKYAYAMIQYFV